MASESKFDPTKCKWHKEEIEGIKDEIWGNGKEGLAKDVASIKTFMRVLVIILSLLTGGIAAVVVKSTMSIP